LYAGRRRSSSRCFPPDEYEDEHLPDAINIPLKTLDGESTRELDRLRPVIVYCYDYQ
jgi:rhodanese-related sulfurtransferase